MAQRVMIAMALACTPELLIADEPTTALDVTIQAQVLDLLGKLRTSMGTSIILITHDLGIVAETCDRVAVMYAGRIVEETDVETLFANPLHPYTTGLIGSVPILGQIQERLQVIPGSVPNLIDLPQGCKFASRCQERLDTLDHAFQKSSALSLQLLEGAPDGFGLYVKAGTVRQRWGLPGQWSGHLPEGHPGLNIDLSQPEQRHQIHDQPAICFENSR